MNEYNFQLDQSSYWNKQLKNVRLRSALPDDIRLWPNGVIPFVIDQSLHSNRALILKAIANYYQHTCIKFIPHSNEYDYINITKDHGYNQIYIVIPMWAELVACKTWPCNWIFHEHQRSDRDTYLKLHEENIALNAMGQFEKLTPNENRLLVSYDYDSIMHYGPTAFARQSGLITMSPRKENAQLTEVFQKYGLSQLDIVAIRKLYKCNG
ncbi:hypothetical protein BLOT_002433 [Blomia tropicalis]|nr:hypothetical protein BLOT_002433 [Blomia tropicalis]